MLFRSGIVAGGGLPPLYLGQVGTRTRWANNVMSATLKQANSKTGFIAMDDITVLQAGFSNWYANSAGEADGAALEEMHMTVEYPLGTYTDFLWGGVTVPSVPAGADLISDPLSITIPRLARGNIWIWRACAAGGMPYMNDTTTFIKDGTFFTDPLQYAASGLTDATHGGTITNSNNLHSYAPSLLLGNTRRSAVLILGTSRAYGTGDTADSSGDMGDIARAIGALDCAYLNGGIPGDRIYVIAGSHTKRFAHLQYFTHCYTDFGTNDDAAGQTLVQEQGNYATIWPLIKAGMQSPAKLYQLVGVPRTNSANDTPATGESVRVARENWIRGLPSPLDGVIDLQSIVATGTNGSLWLNGATDMTDGVHMRQHATLNIKNSGVYTAAQLAR